MINVNGLRIHDLAQVGRRTVPEAFEQSSDVAAVKTGLKLGEDRFYKYIRTSASASRRASNCPARRAGLAKPPNRWSKVSIGAMSMGQEIGVTPVQVISMVSTIANDGVYTPPRIVAGVTSPTQRRRRRLHFKPARRIG